LIKSFTKKCFTNNSLQVKDTVAGHQQFAAGRKKAHIMAFFFVKIFDTL